jgi:hypothetical protein
MQPRSVEQVQRLLTLFADVTEQHPLSHSLQHAYYDLFFGRTGILTQLLDKIPTGCNHTFDVCYFIEGPASGLKATARPSPVSPTERAQQAASLLINGSHDEKAAFIKAQRSFFSDATVLQTIAGAMSRAGKFSICVLDTPFESDFAAVAAAAAAAMHDGFHTITVTNDSDLALHSLDGRHKMHDSSLRCVF